MTPIVCLEKESVRDALDAMRQARPLGATHPLREFISINDEFSARADSQVGGEAGLDAAIFATLARIIRHNLNFNRSEHDLLEITRRYQPPTLAEDFLLGNEELESWSYLYHRFVRVDLDYSVDQIHREVGGIKRTLQRRQERGIARLTYVLADRERRTRLRQRKVLMRAQLPSAYAPKLFGRDELVETLSRQLSEAEPPGHILLYGAPGVGKTALALVAAHRLIEELSLQNLAWIDKPEVHAERLLEQIAFKLGVPLSLEYRPTGYLHLADSLIVLDHAQSLSAETLATIVGALGPARLLICANTSDNAASADLTYLHIPELDKSAAVEMLAYEAERRDRAENTKQFNKLYADLGGIPRALLTAYIRRGHYNKARISEDIYPGVWAALTPLGQRSWLTLALYPGMPEELQDDIQDGLDELIEASIVEVQQSQKPYLLALGQVFAVQMLQHPDNREMAQEVVSYVADQVAQEADITHSLHFLAIAQECGFAPSFLLDLAYAFAPRIEHAGTWAAWSAYLEPLRELVDEGADRLWIGLRLGIAYRWLAKWDAAAYTVSEVMTSAGEGGDFPTQHQALLELATIRRYQEKRSEATQLLKRAEKYYRQHEDAEAMERINSERIQLALDAKNLPLAAQTLTDALPFMQSPSMLSLAALVALRTGDAAQALEYAEKARDGLHDDLPKLARTIALLGEIHYALGNRIEAINHLLSALTMMEGDALGHARARLNLAAIYVGHGHLNTALRYLTALPDEFARLGDLESLQATLSNITLINEARKDS